MLKSSTFSYY